MPEIRIISGTVGIKYTDEYGNERFAAKNASSGPFEVSKELARRFVDERKVAEYVRKSDGNYDDSEEDENLTSKPNSELREIAEKLGGDTRNCKNKAQLIELIESLRSESGEDYDEDELPDISAAEPE